MNKLLNVLIFVAWLVPISVQVLAAPKALAATSKGVAATRNDGNRTARFKIRAMNSPTCPLLVKAVLAKLPGVQSVTADHESKMATVNYDPKRVSPEQMRNAIKADAGFESEIIAR